MRALAPLSLLVISLLQSPISAATETRWESDFGVSWAEGETPIRGGRVLEGKLLVKPVAQYPPIAREARIEGVVRLFVMTTVEGTVAEIRLISGHPWLVPAAMEAVKSYVYDVTLIGGKPVEVVKVVEVRFFPEKK